MGVHLVSAVARVRHDANDRPVVHGGVRRRGGAGLLGVPRRARQPDGLRRRRRAHGHGSGSGEEDEEEGSEQLGRLQLQWDLGGVASWIGSCLVRVQNQRGREIAVYKSQASRESRLRQRRSQKKKIIGGASFNTARKSNSRLMLRWS